MFVTGEILLYVMRRMRVTLDNSMSFKLGGGKRSRNLGSNRMLSLGAREALNPYVYILWLGKLDEVAMRRHYCRRTKSTSGYRFGYMAAARYGGRNGMDK